MSKKNPDKAPQKDFIESWFGPVALTGLFILSLAALLAIMQQHNLEYHRVHLNNDIQGAQQRIERHLNDNRTHLLRQAEKMARSLPDDEGLLSQYLKAHPAVHSVVYGEYLPPTHPLTQKQKAEQGADFNWTASRGQEQTSAATMPSAAVWASRQAYKTRHPAYTEPFKLHGGETGFAVFVPIFREKTFLGVLGEVYSARGVLRHMTSPETRRNYRLSLLDGWGNIMAQFPAAFEVDEETMKTISLRPPGHQVILHMAGHATRYRGWKLSLLALLSIGLALGMAWSMWSMNRDRIRRKRAETELLASQEKALYNERMAVLGKVSSGIAHEIRNPLGVIDSSVYYLKMKLKHADEKTKGHLARISNNVCHCTAIVHHVQSLSKLNEPQKKPVRFADVLEESIARAELPPGVKVEKNLPDSPCFLNADEGQLIILFKNLAVNAAQAMQEQGRLRITVQDTNNAWRKISFEDDGKGIPPENLEKIFQPFFTTKAKGMGFGLAACRLIVEKHGGKMEVKSEPGKGSVFNVFLPAANGDYG
ncbi:MAG: hypothetical protein GY862_32745 [Gammaproteobacteria bacterium]|nr:hypothetical protein [Gammaproteobacteria bacterium]